jgi:hypothetical protein
MSARTVHVKCPFDGCDEIRNEAGLTMHIRRKHGVLATAQ